MAGNVRNKLGYLALLLLYCGLNMRINFNPPGYSGTSETPVRGEKKPDCCEGKVLSTPPGSRPGLI